MTHDSPHHHDQIALYQAKAKAERYIPGPSYQNPMHLKLRQWLVWHLRRSHGIHVTLGERGIPALTARHDTLHGGSDA